MSQNVFQTRIVERLYVMDSKINRLEIKMDLSHERLAELPLRLGKRFPLART